jgi:hypothetical protein
MDVRPGPLISDRAKAMKAADVEALPDAKVRKRKKNVSYRH